MEEIMLCFMTHDADVHSQVDTERFDTCSTANAHETDF